jgi:hypothetical protein
MSATATATKTEKSKDETNKEQAKAALEALEGTCGGVALYVGEVSRARHGTAWHGMDACVSG